MKKLVLLLFLVPFFSYAQAASPWLISGGSSGNIKPVNGTLHLQVTQLGGSGTRCLQVDNNGLFSIAAAACGTGGSSAADPFTHSGTDQSATTTLMISGSASTTLLSVFTKAYFGGSATSTFDSAGKLNLTYGSSTAFGATTGYFSLASTTNLNISGFPGTVLSTSATGAVQATTVSSPLSFSGSTLSITTSGTWSGNAVTATALAANGANCSSGNAPLGVDASGAVESCFDVWTEAENTTAAYVPQTRTLTIAGTANQITSSVGAQDLSANRTVTLSIPSLFAISQASTTLFSSYGPAYFGGSATSSFSTAGALTLVTPLLVASGGSGAGTLTGILLGNGTSAFTALTTSAGIFGAISDETGGTGVLVGSVSPAITGTASLANITVSGTSVHTGLATFGQASTTIFSSYGPAYFGGTATTTISSAGNVALPAAGTLTIPALTSALTLTDGNGLFAEYAGASACASNNFVTTISAVGGTTCGTASISGVSLGGTLAALTATNASLTFSGSYDGSAARTVGLNVGNSNTWTVLQSFSLASTSQLSVFTKAYFGGTATSTFDSTGALTLINALTYGGVTLSNAVTGTGNMVLSASPTFTGKAIFAAASTTDVTCSASCGIPSSSSQAPTAAGYIAQDTTDNQFVVGKAGTTAVFDERRLLTLSISTTTAWTATSSLPSFPIPVGMIVTKILCTTQPSGSTLFAQWQYANPSTYTTVNITMIPASTTPGIYTLSSNNTPAAQATSTISFGNPTGSPTSASCTLMGTVTAT